MHLLHKSSNRNSSRLFIQKSGHNLHSKNLVIFQQNDILIVPFSEILYVNAQSNYTSICLANGKKILSSKHLNFYAEKLNSSFVRIHRSYIVNFDYVTKVSKSENEVKLRNGHCLPISRSRKGAILDFLSY